MESISSFSANTQYLTHLPSATTGLGSGPLSRLCPSPNQVPWFLFQFLSNTVAITLLLWSKSENATSPLKTLPCSNTCTHVFRAAMFTVATGCKLPVSINRWMNKQIPYIPMAEYYSDTKRNNWLISHSSALAWEVPWTEELGRLQSMGLWRVGYDWATSLSLFTFMHWRRKWQPTPVFLPGESQGWETVGQPSMGLHRVGHGWCDLAAAAAAAQQHGWTSKTWC